MKYRIKRRNQDRAKLEKLKSKLLASDDFKDQPIVLRSGGEKMSEVLIKFIEPYLRDVTTSKARQTLVALAAMAWNAALFDETEQQNLLNLAAEELLATAGKDMKNDLVSLLTELIQRKQRYSADNKRLIVSYDLSLAEEGYHLSVASTE
jgi:hypothetical protein